MKIPPFFPSSLPQWTAPEVSVLTDVHREVVSATVHEPGEKGRAFADIDFMVLDVGMGFRFHSNRRTDREIFRPPDPGDLFAELMRRIRKFAGEFEVPEGQIHFYTLHHSRKRSVDRLVLPPVWVEKGVIRRAQERFDCHARREKERQGRDLFLQGKQYLADGRVRAASRLFKSAAEIAPGLYLAYLGLAEAQCREDKWEEALGNLLRSQGLLAETPEVTQKQKLQDAKKIEEAISITRTRLESIASGPADAPTIPQAGPERSQPLDAFPVPVAFSCEGIPPVIEELYRLENFESWDLHLLRLQAERLRFLEGFDALLAPARSHLQPYEHQERTAKIVLRRMQGRALLADEVGLGKTVEAGLVLKEYLLRGMAGKVLILVLPSLIDQWRSEMAEKFEIPFATSEQIQDRGHASFWKDQPLVIASLSLAKRQPHHDLILSEQYDLVIVDEAHHLRNRRTLAWKFINQLKKKFLLFLTATPIHNDLEELYNLATLLRPGQLGTPTDFKARFTERGNVRKCKNPEALRVLLREVMIRNTRGSASVKLPRRIAKTICVEFTQDEQSLYGLLSELIRCVDRETASANRFFLRLLQREAGSSFRAVLPTLQKLSGIVPPGLQPRLAEITGRIDAFHESSKLSALKHILGHTSGKCLIFTEFRGTHEYLINSLREAGYDPGMIHGSLSPEQKAEAVRKFQEDGNILIATPTGGEGTNLQFCRTLVNYDLPWDPMKIEQRIGRIHRIGQTGEIFIYNLVAKETVEHYLLKILDEKLNLFELVVGEAETILGDITEDKDFEGILMDIWLEVAGHKELEEKMEGLGEAILTEKAKYLQARQWDEALFATDYETV